MMENLLLSENRSTVLPPYIEMILSQTGECFFGLKKGYHVLNYLYYENEVMLYGRKSYGRQ